MAWLTDRYAEQIAGVVSCFDRIVIMGTRPGVCYAEGMTTYPRIHGIRLFDYPRFAEPLRDEVRANAERLATEHGLTIEFVRAAGAFRKEDRVHAVPRRVLPGHSGAPVSRLLKRLHVPGLIRKIGHTYTYYLTTPAGKSS